MMNMLRSLFNYMSAPGEILSRRAEYAFIGRRRFLEVDVQGLDGSWHRKQIYIRAQPSREIFRCDIPFKNDTKGTNQVVYERTLERSSDDRKRGQQDLKERHNSGALVSPSSQNPVSFLIEGLNKRARERSRRRPVLIAPLISSSARELIIEGGYEAWRCYVVWKPRLRDQGNKTECKISLEWLKAYRDLAKIVRWFFRVVAARIMRARWGPPKPQRAKGPFIDLAAFLRPDPWPPPGG